MALSEYPSKYPSEFSDVIDLAAAESDAEDHFYGGSTKKYLNKKIAETALRRGCNRAVILDTKHLGTTRALLREFGSEPMQITIVETNTERSTEHTSTVRDIRAAVWREFPNRGIVVEQGDVVDWIASHRRELTNKTALILDFCGNKCTNNLIKIPRVEVGALMVTFSSRTNLKAETGKNPVLKRVGSLSKWASPLGMSHAYGYQRADGGGKRQSMMCCIAAGDYPAGLTTRTEWAPLEVEPHPLPGGYYLVRWHGCPPKNVRQYVGHDCPQCGTLFVAKRYKAGKNGRGCGVCAFPYSIESPRRAKAIKKIIEECKA